jgi:hypothetical protein
MASSPQGAAARRRVKRRRGEIASIHGNPQADGVHCVPSMVLTRITRRGAVVLLMDALQ